VPIVVTIDQRRSRQAEPGRVPAFAAELNVEVGDELRLPFGQTVGDELQGVVHEAAALGEIVMRAARGREWWIGVGFGPAEQLAATARESTGEAFYRARQAVERAKTTAWGVAVEGMNRWAPSVEQAVALLVAVADTRTAQGWEAVDLKLRKGTSDEDVARELGVTRQAVQQRLQAAHYYHELGGRQLVADLAALAESDPPA